MDYNKDKTTLNISYDTSELSPSQERLLRSIASLLQFVSTAEEEAHFFEGSAELVKAMSSLIQQSQFIQNLDGKNSIPYKDQAIEYAIEILQEALENKKIISYDN